MAAVLPEGFDLEALLAPIEGDAPQGVDLREDYSPQSLYFRLRDARSEARAEERQAESLGTNAEAAVPQQWRAVTTTASTVLKEKSKDLEVAAWMTEALVRHHGLAGLTAGALLMKGLAEQYWDGLFPLPDEDGIATRVAPVTGLSGADSDGTLMAALRRLPLFNKPDGSPFQWWEYERSVELAGITEDKRREQRIQAGSIPMDTVENFARASGQAHFAKMRTLLKGTIESWKGMSDVFDNLAGHDSPSTSRVLSLLFQVLDVVARFAPPEEVATEEEAGDTGTGETSEDAAGSGGGGGGGGGGRGPGRSREEVLRQLIEISDFFRKTEPNSPLSYTLQDAVRRARMSWPELLAELVPDDSMRTNILNSLGIRPPEG
jgi:type VI secretion system protein ImpA